jgi:LysM repeat protein
MYWIVALILGIITIVAISLFALMRNPSSGVDLEELYASQTSAAISTSNAELTAIAAAAEEEYTPSPSETPNPSPSPTPTLSPTPTQTPTPLSPTLGPGLETPFGPGAEFILHKVVTGESLQVVASNYRTKKAVITSMNELSFGGILHPDMVLVIVPDMKENLPLYPIFHPVFIDQDATVSSLAVEYGVSLDDLRRYNSLGEGDSLPGGRWIVIPILQTPTP